MSFEATSRVDKFVNTDAKEGGKEATLKRNTWNVGNGQKLKLYYGSVSCRSSVKNDNSDKL